MGEFYTLACPIGPGGEVRLNFQETENNENF